MFKFIGLISISVQSISQPVYNQGPVVIGGENDENGCLIGAGVTWCEAHQSCIREWVTPCEDNFKNCNDCLSKQTNGINIACPVECNMVDTVMVTPLNKPKKRNLGDPISTPYHISYPDTTHPMYPTDPLPPTYTTLPVPEPVITVCPEVMCMMYCENGYLVSDNGCQMCSCQAPTLIPEPDPFEQPVASCDNVPCSGFPSRMANMPCDDGSMGGPVCLPDDTGVCTWTIRSCPVEELSGPEEHIGECPIPLSYCNNAYVCPKVTEVTYCSQGGIPGYTTYKLSLLIKNPIVRTIYAIYGDSDDGVSRPMSIPPAYQSPSFNSNIGGPTPSLALIDYSVNYDSWLTMNTIDGDPYETLSSVGIDFNSWNELHGIYTTDGAIFTTSSPDLNMNGEYIVGQITISDDVVTDVIMNFQGKIVCPGCTSHDTWTETQVTFHLSKPEVVDPNIIPLNCISWYDGCNTCLVNNGQLGGCTRLMCFREDNPYCLSFDGNQQSGH